MTTNGTSVGTKRGCLLCDGDAECASPFCGKCAVLFRDSLESQRYEQHAAAGNLGAGQVAMMDFASRVRAERLVERVRSAVAPKTASGANHAA